MNVALSISHSGCFADNRARAPESSPAFDAQASDWQVMADSARANVRTDIVGQRLIGFVLYPARYSDFGSALRSKTMKMSISISDNSLVYMDFTLNRLQSETIHR